MLAKTRDIHETYELTLWAKILKYVSIRVGNAIDALHIGISQDSEAIPYLVNPRFRPCNAISYKTYKR